LLRSSIPGSGPKKNNKNILRIGVPSKGWLSSPSFELLKKSGFELNGTKRKYAKNSNESVEFILARARDIPKYVECGALDAGITGYDLFLESGLDILDILDLKFGYCRVVVATEESSRINSVEEMKEDVRIATELPNITKKYFAKVGKKVKPIKVDGAVEITPYLAIADGIVDLTTTGRTLRENGLKEIATIVNSSARLIANKTSYRANGNKIRGLVKRIKKAIKNENIRSEKK